MKRYLAVLLLPLVAIGCHDGPKDETGIEPLGAGPYAVGSSNLEIAAEFADIGDEAMHDYLLGRPSESGQGRYLADILRYPESALIVDVQVPDDDAIYGPARGHVLPVVSFVTFPTEPKSPRNPYTFPYHNGAYGAFEDMLGPGEEPTFAAIDERYPLIILAHGASAHGIFDIGRAHNLSRHGYIVAVVIYGDDRTAEPNPQYHHVAYLRPLITKAVLDALLTSETYGPHIDTENVGIAGHSFGGFTSLAIAGGPYLGNTATVSDERIGAASIAAPWVGGNYYGKDLYAFGPDNTDLTRVGIPVISFFGSKDAVTSASFILPAMKHLSGPVYVVELVDQPHVFEAGSWQDRDNWEVLFFAAYLKHDPAALAMLEAGRSMRGGNQDRQLFDYQRVADGARLHD